MLTRFGTIFFFAIGCIPTTGVVGQDKGDASRMRDVRSGNRANPNDRANAQRARKEPLDISMITLRPKEAQQAEWNDAMLIAVHMYALSPEESETAGKLIGEALNARWGANEDQGRFTSLVDRRAELAGKLMHKMPPDAPLEARSNLLARDDEFLRVHSTVEAMEDEAPFHFGDLASRIESTLPPDRVGSARSMWQANALNLPADRIRSQRLFRDVTAGSYEQMRQRNHSSSGAARGPAQMRPRPARRPATPAKFDVPPGKFRTPRQKQDAQSSSKRFPLGNKPATTAKPAPSGPGTSPQPAKPIAVARPPVTTPPVPAAVKRAEPARPLNEWEKYVLEFIQRHSLSETQKNAAMAILQDMSSRAMQIQQANAGRLKDAEKVADPSQRTARLKELNAPVDGLFDRLKARLENLLTAAQRDQAVPKQAGHR
ncbi:MAG TPA: hypothetical protein VNT79_06680 [Phycisphaerae bacterium]|nr:hypothetical protein [Phycisphaerae bacterium]